MRPEWRRGSPTSRMEAGFGLDLFRCQALYIEAIKLREEMSVEFGEVRHQVQSFW